MEGIFQSLIVLFGFHIILYTKRVEGLTFFFLKLFLEVSATKHNGVVFNNVYESHFILPKNNCQQ